MPVLAEIKIFILFVVKFIEGYFHTSLTRFIIKTFVSAKEIPFFSWFNWGFISKLGWKGFAGLGIIASFTLITFPLGIWLSSFSASLFYPLSNLFATAMGMVLIPLNLWTFNRTVKEIQFNNTTMMGLAVIEVGSIIAIVGWYLIYIGNKTV